MEKQFTIKLNGLRFFAKIGVIPQERVAGNEFTVNVELVCDASNFIPENLDTTISYADVYEEIDKIMRQERMLLETVAEEIADTINLRWPKIKSTKVEITKIAPPISGISGNCSVEYYLDNKLC